MSLNPLSLVMDAIAAVTMNPELVATDAGVIGPTGELGSSLATTAGGLGALGATGATPILAEGASQFADTANAIGAGANAAAMNAPSAILGSDIGSFRGLAGLPETASTTTSAFTDAANAANTANNVDTATNVTKAANDAQNATNIAQSSVGNQIPGQAAITPSSAPSPAPSAGPSTTPSAPVDSVGPNMNQVNPLSSMDKITKTFSDTLDNIENWTDKHKFLTQAGLMAAPSIIRGLVGTSTPPVAPKYSGPLSKYHLAGTPGTVGANIAYQPATATPNIYYPHYKKGGLADVESMASGGIASYATGGASNVPTLNPTMYPTSPYISGQNTATNVANAFGRQGMHGGPNDFRNKTTPTPAPVVDPAPTPNTNIYHPSYGTTGLAAASPTQTVAPTINIDSEGNPVFAEGGMVAFGLGGQVNNAYPQSQQEHTQFANPINLPTMAANAQYEPKTDPYSGQMLSMAEGGVAKYATGGNILLEAYYNMTNKKQAAAPKADVGIYQDSDANTRNLNAFEAAKYRHNALAKYVNAPGLAYNDQASLPQANLNPLVQAQNKAQAAAQPEQELASGGIAGYNLGGYATGGNSRLLKGPGDGMSDNIPATIADKQPARLADGEFVIPADVVSHLGNGSTDAGAKKLHTMMNKVRVARTGKKAQGTQINPDKYLPS